MLSRDLKDRNRQPEEDPGHTVWLSDGILRVDLNCDLGEGMDNDAHLFPFISSANIACGYHAGDNATMRRTVQLAIGHGVAIGAHPSYPDREDFGRVDLLEEVTAGMQPALTPGARPGLTLEEIPGIITVQLGALQKICVDCGAKMHHVKLHGALYNRAARDPALGDLVCRAIQTFNPSLLLYGPGGSAMEAAAGRYGLSFIREVFADRTYREDGSLTPRSAPGALIGDAAQAIGQVLMIVRERKALTTGGLEVPLIGETVCIHGDGPHAVLFAHAIRDALEKELIIVQAP